MIDSEWAVIGVQPPDSELTIAVFAENRQFWTTSVDDAFQRLADGRTLSCSFPF
jgi:hypothetical protein